MLRSSVAVSLALLALTSNARADMRSFTHTYEYSTVPEGRTDVELTHTQGRTTWHGASPQFFEQIIELEHGLTDHWDAAFYTVFAETSARDPLLARPFGLDSVRLETRYRFADRGEWPVDTLVYLEVAKDFGQSLYEIEGKVIAARDFDKMTVAVNAISELRVGRDLPETGLTLGWAGGLTYQAHNKVRVGAETWGEYEDKVLYVSAGPAMNFALSSNFWLAMTAGFGITSDADAFSGRVIFGIQL
jgi:hypothetical protein